METSAVATDLWGVIGIIVVTGGTVISGWLTLKAKRGADEQDKAAGPVLADTEQRHDLSAAVDALAEQVAKLRSEVDLLKPIAHLKYPMSLGVIRDYRSRHPDTPVHIPYQIRDDL